MKKFKQLILYCLLLASCSVGVSQENEDWNTNLTPKKNVTNIDTNKKYSPGNSFIYEVIFDSIGTVRKEYLIMTVYPEKYDNQNFITYEYYDKYPLRDQQDSIIATRRNTHVERTLLYETSAHVYIHPPRQYYSELTQYTPFPEANLPIKKGKKYKRSYLSINDPICNCKILLMKYKMKIEEVEKKYDFLGNLIDVYVIRGKSSNSKLGVYTTEYLFNEKLGFLYYEYSANDSVFLKIRLQDFF